MEKAAEPRDSQNLTVGAASVSVSGWWCEHAQAQPWRRGAELGEAAGAGTQGGCRAGGRVQGAEMVADGSPATGVECRTPAPAVGVDAGV